MQASRPDAGPDAASGDRSGDRSDAPPPDKSVSRAIDRYWRHNVRLMLWLLAIWALVSLGCGVLFAAPLNRIVIGGFPLGFWFAQQGSIIVFLALVLVYALALDRLDARHHRELEDLAVGKRDGGGDRDDDDRGEAGSA